MTTASAFYKMEESIFSYQLSAFSDEAAVALDEQISALQSEGISMTELRSVKGR